MELTVAALGRESADLLHLPAEGTVFDQPRRTMEAVEIVRQAFAEQLREEFRRANRG